MNKDYFEHWLPNAAGFWRCWPIFTVFGAKVHRGHSLTLGAAGEIPHRILEETPSTEERLFFAVTLGQIQPLQQDDTYRLNVSFKGSSIYARDEQFQFKGGRSALVYEGIKLEGSGNLVVDLSWHDMRAFSLAIPVIDGKPRPEIRVTPGKAPLVRHVERDTKGLIASVYEMR